MPNDWQLAKMIDSTGCYIYAIISILDVMPDDNGCADAQGLTEARAQGRQMGNSAECWAGMCPYRLDQFQLRSAWMAGFSEGRMAWRPFPAGPPSKQDQ